MEQTVVSIRMDKKQKEQFEIVAELMGITTSGLMNIFINRVIAEKKLPFPLCVPVNP
jgi:addiction module RelB/DinJ family antitoxin